MFCKKGVLKNFAKFTGKHMCQGLVFKKVTSGSWCHLENSYSELSHAQVHILESSLSVIFCRGLPRTSWLQPVWDTFPFFKILPMLWDSNQHPFGDAHVCFSQIYRWNYSGLHFLCWFEMNNFPSSWFYLTNFFLGQICVPDRLQILSFLEQRVIFLYLG